MSDRFLFQRIFRNAWSINHFTAQKSNFTIQGCWFAGFTLQSFIPWVLCSWYSLIKIEQYENLNPFLLLARMFLSIVMASEISNMLDMRIDEWPVILILINHCYFITTFYLQKNPVIYIAKKIFTKCFSKKNAKRTDNHQEKKMVMQILSGYMLDFQLIMIPRLLIIRFLRSWMGIHHLVEFYKNCSLEISDEFMINDNMLDEKHV